ncbi:hypothetical protein A5650_24880 [Mycobacterium sp. 1164985.4]|jgi:hypothetical protein|uniref:Uncharacterized protein n=3 Tax=Mycobacteriaceae TaxID=1762 RepID=A0A1A3P8Z5_MYCAS|nr:hypothetical protein [Mycolicibacterium hippocampi]OBK29062.1 hypothetical protein A5634_18870 [Mycobacterium asiaticum]OBK81790.1 hypothetical protein A5650_24880 [Mycobacterium sp. 1164985.4]PZT85661.1 MAG: hypothetical protein DI630_35840 [Gordonia sp. (in: high G+C Gram-positive bacteria)]VBA31327.1 hypothetical protein LAUMK35_04999 [Mycobacterium pseudokansasii]
MRMERRSRQGATAGLSLPGKTSRASPTLVVAQSLNSCRAVAEGSSQDWVAWRGDLPLPPPPRLSSPDRAQLGNGLAVISNHQKAFSLPDAGQRSVQVITDLLHIQRRHRQAMLTAWETAEPARWVQRAMDVSLKRLF